MASTHIRHGEATYACGSLAAKKIASPGFSTIVFSRYGAITPTSPGYLASHDPSRLL